MTGGLPDDGAALRQRGGRGDAKQALRLLFPEPGLLYELEKIRIAGGRRTAGSMAGKRLSATLGGSQEFADYRPYAPGDDVRRVDWNVYGRTGKAFVRQYWDEQELPVHLYIDTTWSMRFPAAGEANKLLYASRLAACAGFAALCGDDRVSIRLFDEAAVREATPLLHGRSAAGRLFGALGGLVADTDRQADDSDVAAQGRPGDAGMQENSLSAESGSPLAADAASGNRLPSEERLTPELAGASDMSLPFRRPGALPGRPGVTWLLTDAMYEQGVAETIALLKSAGQHTVLVHLLSPEELAPTLSGELRLIDSELGTGKEVALSGGVVKRYMASVRQYRADLERLCVARHAVYCFIDTGLPLKSAIRLLLTGARALRA